MALTAPKFVPQRADSDKNVTMNFLAAANTTFYPGALVCANATGFLTNGITGAGLTAIGIFTSAQNGLRPATSYVSGGTDGASAFDVKMGTFLLNNSGTDPVVQADLGKVVYIEDNQTVSHTATGKSAAGVFMGFSLASDPQGAGCWVAVGAADVSP